ncbi:MAG: HAD family hydrolase, partial [Pseudomonadota bacterium]
PQTVTALHRADKDVHILSGGLRQAILPLGAMLGIPSGNIHAVDVMFHADGSYKGFDEASPLARPGGKAEICRKLGASCCRVALVGDGATDIEAREGGAFVIGFGGIIARDAVISGADIYVPGPGLSAVLKPLLG